MMRLIDNYQFNQAHFSEELLAKLFIAKRLHRHHASQPITFWITPNSL